MFFPTETRYIGSCRDFLRSLSGHLFYPNAIHSVVLIYLGCDPTGFSETFEDAEAVWHKFFKRQVGHWIAGVTVDGSEIRRSPVEVGSFSHYLQGFIHPTGGCLGFLPSSFFLCLTKFGDLFPSFWDMDCARNIARIIRSNGPSCFSYGKIRCCSIFLK